jgi:RimJ/RimL family protein N-acetyltransferase
MNWDATPTLVGRHVTLRPLVADDKDALVAAASADDLWDLFYANVAMMKAPDHWFAAAFREQDFGRARIFAVVAGSTVVGSTRFMRMNAANKRLEIGGTFYATAVQRTGVNTEAKLMLLTYAFETLGCECVQIRTDSLNKRSQAAIERLARQMDRVVRLHEGLLREDARPTTPLPIAPQDAM